MAFCLLLLLFVVAAAITDKPDAKKLLHEYREKLKEAVRAKKYCFDNLGKPKEDERLASSSSSSWGAVVVLGSDTGTFFVMRSGPENKHSQEPMEMKGLLPRKKVVVVVVMVAVVVVLQVTL